jgi:TPR repeat protein
VSIRKSLTDVELCRILDPGAEKFYRRALDVLMAYPDYALVEFRRIAECLVAVLAARNGLEPEAKDLFSRINELKECQLIDWPLSKSLHQIRDYGNEAVHSVASSSNPVGRGSEPNPAGDVARAIQARKILVGIFESFFLLLNKNQDLPSVEQEEVGDLSSQQALWKATTHYDDFESKLAAGLIFEAQSMIAQNERAVILSRKEDAHQQSLIAMAVAMYRAACEISANLDSLSIIQVEMVLGGWRTALVKRADTEALYRFGRLTYYKEAKDDTQQLGALAIEEAAKRGHIEACLQFGEYLRMSDRFDEALAMMRFASESGSPLAELGLFTLYNEEGSPHYSPQEAVHALETGITRNCSKCMMELGRILYEGKHGLEDKDRGKLLIEQASEQGLTAATFYLRLCVDDTLTKGLRRIGHALKMSVDVETATIKSQRPGRNDRCPCGSSKKYKVCHGA